MSSKTKRRSTSSSITRLRNFSRSLQGLPLLRREGTQQVNDRKKEYNPWMVGPDRPPHIADLIFVSTQTDHHRTAKLAVLRAPVKETGLDSFDRGRDQMPGRMHRRATEGHPDCRSYHTALLARYQPFNCTNYTWRLNRSSVLS